MEMTISLKELGWILIVIALLMLLIYAIVLIKNLIPVVKNANQITEDAKAITGIAKKRTEEVDSIMDDVKGSAKNLADAFKGKESLVASLSSIAKAIASLVGMIKGQTTK